MKDHLLSLPAKVRKACGSRRLLIKSHIHHNFGFFWLAVSVRGDSFLAFFLQADIGGPPPQLLLPAPPNRTLLPPLPPVCPLCLSQALGDDSLVFCQNVKGNTDTRPLKRARFWNGWSGRRSHATHGKFVENVGKNRVGLNFSCPHPPLIHGNAALVCFPDCQQTLLLHVGMMNPCVIHFFRP